MEIDQIFESSPGYNGSVSAIRLVQMPQQIEVREPEDDWTGLNNANERRKLQNRLNQRIWRKRQKAKKGKSTSGKASVPKSSNSSTRSYDTISLSSIGTGSDTEVKARRKSQKIEDTTPSPLDHPPISTSLCRTSPAVAREMVSRFETWIHQNYILGSPRVDLLLTLIQFNVFRALLSNTTSLGFDMEWLISEDAKSPFHTSSPEIWNHSLPHCLRPTKLQHEVEHHPWIDLFPIPAMRDNILRNGASYDDSDICADIVEISDKPKEKAGLIVWGEPWNIYSWEASPEFLRKWGWIVEGCHELLQSTNYWRKLRGEKKILH